MTTEPQADIVERLLRPWFTNGCEAYQHEAAAEITRLRARLEVEPGWPESADGIACRDETIRLQDARIASLRAEVDEARDDASIWRPSETAPTDGSYILVRLAVIDDERWAHLSGRAFVVRHEGTTRNGYDLGWALYPGFGGAPDHWIDAWRAIDPATLMKDADHG